MSIILLVLLFLQIVMGITDKEFLLTRHGEKFLEDFFNFENGKLISVKNYNLGPHQVSLFNRDEFIEVARKDRFKHLNLFQNFSDLLREVNGPHSHWGEMSVYSQYRQNLTVLAWYSNFHLICEQKKIFYDYHFALNVLVKLDPKIQKLLIPYLANVSEFSNLRYTENFRKENQDYYYEKTFPSEWVDKVVHRVSKLLL